MLGSRPAIDRKRSLGPELYSIVVVNFNGGALLLDCLDSVFKFTSDFELVLVDNGSTDGSETEAVRHFPRLKLIKNKTNLGFAKANNIGIRESKGEWVVLLNPDTMVTPSWLESLAKCAIAASEIAIVTPKLLRPDGKTLDSTGHLFDFRTGYTKDRGSGELDVGQFDEVEEVPSCCFACASIRRDVIHEIGLLDERMILYFEDVDFSLRARVAGWKVLYCPRSVVYHHRGGLTTTGSTSLQRRAIAYRLRVILKCYSFGNAVKYGTLRVFRDVMSMAAGIKNNDPQYFLSYLRSPIWNVLNLPVRERAETQSSRRILDSELGKPIV